MGDLGKPCTQAESGVHGTWQRKPYFGRTNIRFCTQKILHIFRREDKGVQFKVNLSADFAVFLPGIWDC